MFLVFFVPRVRQAFVSLGVVLVSVLGLVAVVVVACIIYESAQRRAPAGREAVIRAFELHRIERGSAVSLPQEPTAPTPLEDTSRYAPPPKPEVPKPEPLRASDLVAGLRSVEGTAIFRIIMAHLGSYGLLCWWVRNPA